jgi:large subunit ribosomal protein L15
MKMPQRFRKIRKLRGSRSHGWGVRQHKGKGSHGGFGKAQGHKGKWTYTVKYEPTHYGKHGFQSHTNIKPITINVGELDVLTNRLLAEGHAVKEDTLCVIDLDKLGIGKLLGSGSVKHRLKVKVRAHSQLAAKKIEAAQGMILTMNDKAPDS